jgi:hypothetical protein
MSTNNNERSTAGGRPAATCVVTLSQEEVEIAAMIGCRRRAESKARGRIDNHGLGKADLWAIDIEGAAAEMAYCKFRGKFWSGSVNSFKGPDCGQNVQIRSTHHDYGCLIIRHQDSDNDIYVLLVGVCPTFTICGWIKGVDGKSEEFAQSPNGRPPAFFIPQHKLTKFKL